MYAKQVIILNIFCLSQLIIEQDMLGSFISIVYHRLIVCTFQQDFIKWKNLQ